MKPLTSTGMQSQTYILKKKKNKVGFFHKNYKKYLTDKAREVAQFIILKKFRGKKKLLKDMEYSNNE